MVERWLVVSVVAGSIPVVRPIDRSLAAKLQTRHEFIVDDLSVAVDLYDQSAYLEIEGDNKEEIMQLWNEIQNPTPLL